MSATDKKVEAALAVLKMYGQWGKGHLRDGTKVYAIPGTAARKSDPPILHLCHFNGCDCKAFEMNKARGSDPLPCKHIAAVRFAISVVRGQEKYGEVHPERDGCKCARIDCPQRLAWIVQTPVSVNPLKWDRPVQSQEERQRLVKQYRETYQADPWDRDRGGYETVPLTPEEVNA